MDYWSLSSPGLLGAAVGHLAQGGLDLPVSLHVTGMVAVGWPAHYAVQTFMPGYGYAVSAVATAAAVYLLEKIAMETIISKVAF